MPTFLLFPYLMRSSMLPFFINGQPASISTYSHFISAVKSIYFFCASKSFGVDPSDHQLQLDRPGLIHDTSLITEGGLSAETRVVSCIADNVGPIIATRHGVFHGSVEMGSGSALLVTSSFSGKRIEYVLVPLVSSM